MNIDTEIIIKKLEEKLSSIKYSVTHNEKVNTEALITIKAYCDLLIEADKGSNPKTERMTINKQIDHHQNPRKYDINDEDESDSLFDF